MSKVIDDPVRANQLARAIAADISLYHAEQIDEARPRGPDAVLTQLAEALGEGQELYNSRVSPEIAASTIFWDAITEVVLKGQPPNHSSAPPSPATSAASSWAEAHTAMSNPTNSRSRSSGSDLGAVLAIIALLVLAIILGRVLHLW